MYANEKYRFEIIYIVEESGFDIHHIYGYYATRELARLKLNNMYNEERRINNRINDPEITIQKVDADLFVYKFQGRIHNYYRVKEVKVILNHEDVGNEESIY